MKRFLIILIEMVILTSLFGQVPQGFSYQAVIRNGEGDPLQNQQVAIRITLQMVDASTDYYSETHSVTTSPQGVVNLTIGDGSLPSSDFSLVPWSEGNIQLMVEVDPQGGDAYTTMGTTKLLAVPYSVFAQKANEFVSPTVATDEDPLFVVRNNAGQIVFAVYNTGVRVYVDDTGVKGTKGGFAIGGLSDQTKPEGYEYLRVTPDSVRININTVATGLKATRGGFAVGGLSDQTKALPTDMLFIAPDSARIYVNSPTAKQTRGGFAVGGLSDQTKATSSNFLFLTPENYFIGHESGYQTQSFEGSDHGKYNVFIGYQTGKENLTGLKNVFIGYNVAKSNTHGMTNVYIGTESGFMNTLGYDNVFIGSQSGYSNTEGINNVFLGSNSGYTNSIGVDNVFVGFETGYSNTIGIRNTFIGNKAGRANIDGNDNIFIGELAGYSNESGSENIFIGKRVGHGAVNAEENTFIGSYSGQQTTTGSQNTFLGHGTGLANSEGSQNTYIGSWSSNKNDLGSMNVTVGFNAGGWSFGSNNTFIGVGSGFNSLGDSCVFIGYNAGSNETNSNMLYISNSETEFPLIKGDFATGKTTLNSTLNLQAVSTFIESPEEGDIIRLKDGIQPDGIYIYNGTDWVAIVTW